MSGFPTEADVRQAGIDLENERIGGPLYAEELREPSNDRYALQALNRSFNQCLREMVAEDLASALRDFGKPIGAITCTG